MRLILRSFVLTDDGQCRIAFEGDPATCSARLRDEDGIRSLETDEDLHERLCRVLPDDQTVLKRLVTLLCRMRDDTDRPSLPTPV